MESGATQRRSRERGVEVERLRREQCSEEAANELLALFDEAYDLFKESRSHGSRPVQSVVMIGTRPIRRLTVLLGNQEVRRRIEGVATMFEQVGAI